MTNISSRSLDFSIRGLKKFKNWLGSIRTVGLRGFPPYIRSILGNTSARYISHEVEDLSIQNLLFRYATCNDMISLMGKYPQYCREDRDSNKSTVWGLKSIGTLFCVDRIVQLKPERVLEIGPGWNRHFDEHFGAELDYWMMDDASDIGWDKHSQEKFELSVAERKHTRFVRGYLGGFSPELPANGFDLVFSISVVEHVPPEHKAGFYKDMYRIVKPGGFIAHSIDMFDDSLNLAEYEVISRAGFTLPRKADLRVRVQPSQGNPTLFEDLWTVYHGYMGLNRPDKWDNLKRISGHNATLLVFAQKPV
ncbi:MAG TPA: methyltransferase domain-containing protein [Anaerolineales bacterium]|nr:methyltransferase domain-containing protein [Anaerolineales bacterium]